MKNIVIFTNTLLSGGAEKQAVLLAHTLKNTYHVIVVIYYGDKVEDKYQYLMTDPKIKVIPLFGNHFKKMILFYRLLKNFKANTIFSYLLTTNLIGALIGGLANVPLRVGGIRNAVLDKKKLPLQRFINNYLSSHTIYNNYTGLEQLRKDGFKSKNAVVIPNCFEMTTEEITRSDHPVVNLITVGRFVHQKGYFEALQIMSALKLSGVKFKYFLIGFGEQETELRGKIDELVLNDVVELIINPENINEYYKRSDIYLCTSYFEGLSNTVMEALSFSIPVVATNVGDNNRLVIDGINGFLVSDVKYELFLEPLKKLIGSSGLRNKMGKKSYEIIKAGYSPEAFKKNYTRFLETNS